MACRQAAAVALAGVLAAASLGVAGFSNPPGLRGPAAVAVAAAVAKVPCVGAENEYADVVAQVGGRYVSVHAIVSNPNTDPHEFEASASVSEEIGQAQLVVQNGVGYDAFMDRVESATPHRGRDVIVAQRLLKVTPNAFNPHLWYDPRAMIAVAGAVATALARLDPPHAGYFRTSAAHFDASLRPWLDALAALERAHRRTPVAVTEPVADYMLQAAGVDVLTPRSLQSAVMNGTDPSPQDIAKQDTLIQRHQVKALLYNEQVTDNVTAGFLSLARRSDVPAVGVYETMPARYHYQSWMMAELAALEKAVGQGASTGKL